MSRLGDCARRQIMGVMGNDYIPDVTVVVRVNHTMLKHQLSHRAKLGTLGGIDHEGHDVCR